MNLKVNYSLTKSKLQIKKQETLRVVTIAMIRST